MTDLDHRVLEYPPRSRDARPPSGRYDRRSRSGRRLLGLGALLLLLSGLAVGVWRHYAQHLEVTAAAEQHRDFVPIVRVEAVRASANTMSVTLPATTNAFQAANIYARASGYITQRNVDIGVYSLAGSPLRYSSTESCTCCSGTCPTSSPTNQGEPRTGPGHLGPRRRSRQARLGHPAAGRHRSPELCGSTAGETGQ